MNADTLAVLKIPNAFTEREDLKHSVRNFVLKKPRLLLRAKSLSPLDIFGLYALNGKDSDRARAESESLKDTRSSYAIGLKFSMPWTFLH
ncbi:MAG: hypothetical protein R3A80_12215 [Bdellovibrionota bacterium]